MAEPLWVYGIAPTPVRARLNGVEGRPVTAIVHGELAALVSPAPFTRAELERRLDDLDSLAALARAHDAVLEAALRDGDVVPFPICTLYATAGAVRAMLAAESDRFARVLARLRGKVELGVKAYRQASPEPAPATSGTDYLRRRRAERDRAGAADQLVADAHDRLAGRADAAVLLRPQDPRLSGRRAEMLLNGAYLVRRTDAAGFAELVEALRGDDLSLELTGPWPAYHFAA
jgi:hypothetical protein